MYFMINSFKTYVNLRSMCIPWNLGTPASGLLSERLKFQALLYTNRADHNEAPRRHRNCVIY